MLRAIAASYWMALGVAVLVLHDRQRGAEPTLRRAAW